MNITKQIYLSLLPIYPTVSFVIDSVRGDTYFTKFYVNRVDYPINDQDLSLFEDEIIKMSNRSEDPLNDVRFTISASDEKKESVYGILMFRTGVDFEFPRRMLVRSVEEFRSYISDIIHGATGKRIDPSVAAKISDKEIEATLLDDAARRFLFQRSLAESTAYAMFSSKYGVWCVSVLICYPVFLAISKYISRVVAIFAGGALATCLFMYVRHLMLKSKDLELDRRVYTIDDSYAAGCEKFLNACINFGLLMNRLAQDERAFTKEGNLTTGNAPYTLRRDLAREVAFKKQSAEKAQKLRMS